MSQFLCKLPIDTRNPGKMCKQCVIFVCNQQIDTRFNRKCDLLNDSGINHNHRKSFLLLNGKFPSEEK